MIAEMSGQIAFVSTISPNGEWVAALERELPGHPVVAISHRADLAGVQVDRVEYAVVATPPPGLVAELPNLRFIQSLWAGVDALLADPTLPDVPLARLIDPVLTETMTVSVVAHVTSLHIGLHRYRRDQAERRWEPRDQVPASDVTVLMLGIGELGTACAQVLVELGFRVIGWSRTPKSIPNVEVVVGTVADALSRADIVVDLLPLTPDTRNVLDAKALSAVRHGTCLINVGRGATLDHAALVEMLDIGQIEHAVLDVFETEPLPADDPLWTHPSITITPHVAATTTVASATSIAARNIERFERTGTAENIVDRTRAY